jgi:hypothetical protein
MTRKYEMHVDLKASTLTLAAAAAPTLLILPLPYYSSMPILANVLIRELIYLAICCSRVSLMGLQTSYRIPIVPL